MEEEAAAVAAEPEDAAALAPAAASDAETEDEGRFSPLQGDLQGDGDLEALKAELDRRGVYGEAMQLVLIGDYAFFRTWLVYHLRMAHKWHGTSRANAPTKTAVEQMVRLSMNPESSEAARLHRKVLRELGCSATGSKPSGKKWGGLVTRYLWHTHHTSGNITEAAALVRAIFLIASAAGELPAEVSEFVACVHGKNTVNEMAAASGHVTAADGMPARPGTGGATWDGRAGTVGPSGVPLNLTMCDSFAGKDSFGEFLGSRMEMDEGALIAVCDEHHRPFGKGVRTTFAISSLKCASTGKGLLQLLREMSAEPEGGGDDALRGGRKRRRRG
eukprot:COSAG04_NODE_10_length_43369_cov_4.059025_18_plen_331_part_00